MGFLSPEKTFLPPERIKQFYEQYQKQLSSVRTFLQRPLTLSEKIVFSHAINFPHSQQNNQLLLTIDRVAMQDATAQMCILQFMTAGRATVAVPTTVHCDHLIIAKSGADKDLQHALLENSEVYQFLKSAANKYGMDFWKPGSGIIHQVLLENYAVPGQLMIGTDSHTPNAGGLSMIAIGVGGADAVDAMVGLPWNISSPKRIGIHLKGRLNGWTSPKDIILKVAETMTVEGGTGYIVEYFGEGTKTISATGKATITNMGAEVGATTSIFPYDHKTAEYLHATNRSFVADLIETMNLHAELQADPEIEQNPLQFFDEVIVIDLNELEPHVNGPHSPDRARPISALKNEVQTNEWPPILSAALIGSCTNSSYEDMSRAASIAAQAAAHGIIAKVPFMITPGSEQIYKTMRRDGLIDTFERISGTVLANACGPCIGQWSRSDIKQGQKNSIITSYNRNFKKRNDDNPETHAFVASPEIVTAYALAGTLEFNPLAEPLTTDNGTQIFLKPPQGMDLPNQGFVFDTSGYEASIGTGEILINENSERLAFLKPFPPWKPEDFTNLLVLAKAKGKCTTDHISPAGKWLAYRGHLDKISDNLFSGVVNAFWENVGTTVVGNTIVGKGKNILTNEIQPYSAIARHYQKNQQGWIAIGDENYGEGSSREHAAMEPRYLGCRAIIARSFARIAEANLKKQGILPLWFVDKNDYDKIQEEDRITMDNIINIDGRVELDENQPVYLSITHSDGSIDAIPTRHTLTSEQISWFAAGSALNWLRERERRR